MNDAVHYAVGLLLVAACGITGRRRLALALFAIAPDWDALTTPLVPLAIDAFDLGHEAGHTLAIALGHGAFSHSLLAVGGVFAIAIAAGLRGRSLLAGGLALASHYPLDFVLTWSVWPLLPFSDYGIAWGLVTSGDLVVSALAVLLALPFMIQGWRRRELPRFLPHAALALVLAAFLVPAVIEARVLDEHAASDRAVVDPVSYTRYALVEMGETDARLVLVDVLRGTAEERIVPRQDDRTGGAGAHAMTTIVDALEDADAPSPLVHPIFRALPGEEEGTFRIEVREAKSVIAEDEQGLDFILLADGRVRSARAVPGILGIDRVPVEALPTWVVLEKETR